MVDKMGQLRSRRVASIVQQIALGINTKRDLNMVVGDERGLQWAIEDGRIKEIAPGKFAVNYLPEVPVSPIYSCPECGNKITMTREARIHPTTGYKRDALYSCLHYGCIAWSEERFYPESGLKPWIEPTKAPKKPLRKVLCIGHVDQETREIVFDQVALQPWERLGIDQEIYLKLKQQNSQEIQSKTGAEINLQIKETIAAGYASSDPALKEQSRMLQECIGEDPDGWLTEENIDCDAPILEGCKLRNACSAAKDQYWFYVGDQQSIQLAALEFFSQGIEVYPKPLGNNGTWKILIPFWVKK